MDASSYENRPPYASRESNSHTDRPRNGANVLHLFDRPIAFHRCFVTLTGSVTAALMLSQALYWQRRCKDPEGWWYKTRDDWFEETGLSRYEQEGARKRLRKLGVMQEHLRGVPATIWYRVNEDLLLEYLSKAAQPKALNPVPVSGKPAVQLVENQPTGRRKTHQLDGGKPAIQLAEFAPTFKGTETTTEIKTETTTTTTADLATVELAPTPEPARSSGSNFDLIFDSSLASLTPAQRARAAKTLEGLSPEIAQQVVDEWGQAIKTNRIQKSKWAWLEGVTRKAKAGTFTPTTDAAERRQAENRHSKAQEEFLQRLPDQPLPPKENRPRARPEGLKALLKAVSPLLKPTQNGLPP